MLPGIDMVPLNSSYCFSDNRRFKERNLEENLEFGESGAENRYSEVEGANCWSTHPEKNWKVEKWGFGHHEIIDGLWLLFQYNNE